MSIPRARTRQHLKGYLQTVSSRRTAARGRRAAQFASERGDSLIEVLIAIVVLGLAGVSLIGAISSAVGASAGYRSLATLEVVLKNFAEEATYQIQLQQPTPWFDTCAVVSGTTPNFYYGSHLVGYQPPAGYTVQIKRVEVLSNNTSFVPQGTCDPSKKSPQLITVTATSPNGTTKDLSFVVASPKIEGNYVPPPTTTSTTTTSTTTTTTTIPKGVHVSSMSGDTDGPAKHTDQWDALVTIYVKDTSGNRVSGAVVTGTWDSNFSTSTTSCTTDSSGSCTVEDGVTTRIPSDTESVTYSVSGVTSTGSTYDAAANFPSPARLTVERPR